MSLNLVRFTNYTCMNRYYTAIKDIYTAPINPGKFYSFPGVCLTTDKYFKTFYEIISKEQQKTNTYVTGIESYLKDDMDKFLIEYRLKHLYHDTNQNIHVTLLALDNTDIPGSQYLSSHPVHL